MEHLVLTVIGQDRPGLVEAISRTVAEHGGNWEASRMAHLANRFAGILQVSAPPERADGLVTALGALEEQGLRIVIERGVEPAETAPTRAARLELVGGDRPGITRSIAQALAGLGVNVEDLETDVVTAPMDGTPLFELKADIRIPPDLKLETLRQELERLAGDLMVDLTISEPSP